MPALRAVLSAGLSLLLLAGCGSEQQSAEPAAPEADTTKDSPAAMQQICDDVMQDAQGDLSDELFEDILEELGVGSAPPTIEASDNSVFLDNVGICLANIEQHLTNEYGISAATFERMKSTRALDGEKSAQTDDWSVYWTYHPDSGLDIILERN